MDWKAIVKFLRGDIELSYPEAAALNYLRAAHDLKPFHTREEADKYLNTLPTSNQKRTMLRAIKQVVNCQK